MRTTVSLDDDVAAAVQRMRAERNIGLSEALNELARAGLSVPSPRTRFVQRTFPMGARIDPTNIADAVEFLEGPDHR
ncbi:MAG TPA: ribbon-helix-helix protein, CopG family [Pseudonocardiaceae bacterium]|jgi:Ribbon-helix-helix protein, copG family